MNTLERFAFINTVLWERLRASPAWVRAHRDDPSRTALYYRWAGIVTRPSPKKKENGQ